MYDNKIYILSACPCISLYSEARNLFPSITNSNLQLLLTRKYTNDDNNIQFLKGIKYRMRYINKRSRRGVEISNKFACQMREGASGA